MRRREVMKIKQGLKKLSALCLALVMVLGISVPTVANAEEKDTYKILSSKGLHI